MYHSASIDNHAAVRPPISSRAGRHLPHRPARAAIRLPLAVVGGGSGDRRDRDVRNRDKMINLTDDDIYHIENDSTADMRVYISRLREEIAKLQQIVTTLRAEPGIRNEQLHEHEWIVYFTISHPSVILLRCRSCDANGEVYDYSPNELERASSAHEAPYLWIDNKRVVRTK